MVNIKDPDAADKIIRLERAFGFYGAPEVPEGSRWEAGLKRDIADIQRGISDRIHIRFDDVVWAEEGSGTCIRRGWIIYGQGGFDRFRIQEEDGNILFIKDQCTHTKTETAVTIASELGFSII